MTDAVNRSRERVYKKMQASFEKHDWTQEQGERFETFVNEQFTNYPTPTKNVLSYLTLLNQVVESIKKPFSDMTMDDLDPLVQEWQEKSSAIAHGWRCKLKEFLRWESGNKSDPRAEEICDHCPQGQLYRSKGSERVYRSCGHI